MPAKNHRGARLQHGGRGSQTAERVGKRFEPNRSLQIPWRGFRDSAPGIWLRTGSIPLSLEFSVEQQPGHRYLLR